MKNKRFIAIKNQADTSTLELFFLDVIGDKFDWYTGWTSQVQEVIDKVNAYKPSKIKVVIDSEGGDAQAGMSIYNFLKRCDAKVEVEIIGLAASIAAVIAMAANKGKLKIARNGFMMIHNAEGGCWGTAEEIRKHADVVEMYTGQIVDILSQRTGKTVDEIRKLISDGDYWLTGEDAVTQGFADETFNDNPDFQVAARLSDPSIYKNIPAQIRAQMKPDTTDQNSFIQNQFTEMKKFFTDIVNAIRGVKPGEKLEDLPKVANQIAEAVQAPFEKLGDEIDTQITNQVNTAIASDAVNGVIKTQVENAVKVAVENAAKPQVVDFTADGPAKTAVENAVKVAVEAAVKPYTEQITALETKNKDLEKEITNLKGSETTSGNSGKDEPSPIGKFG